MHTANSRPPNNNQDVIDAAVGLEGIKPGIRVQLESVWKPVKSRCGRNG